MTFKWLPHCGRRHAVSASLGAGEAGQTLCGDPVEPPRDPWRPKNCWPTCAVCDAVWRREVGILPWPR
ncbi:MAG TPA: zinc finger protein [Umezawaea sp.]|nr:zinc finger protein [Umezawaea sp.]